MRRTVRRLGWAGVAIALAGAGCFGSREENRKDDMAGDLAAEDQADVAGDLPSKELPAEEASADTLPDVLAPTVLVADPAVLDLGGVESGCGESGQACFRNDGTAPVTLDDVEVQDCSPEISVKVPALPVVLAPGESFCVKAGFLPREQGAAVCLLSARAIPAPADAPHVLVVGVGVPGAERVDEFRQVTGQEVDVLFAIDDSPSMCAYQDRLRANLQAFADRLGSPYLDAHLGMVTVEGLDAAVAGRLDLGTGAAPLYLDRTMLDQVSTRLVPGCAGTADGSERGLAAIQAALGLGRTETGCDDDAECAWRLCDEDPACPFTCQAGTCGGPNGDFLREDAQLEIIVVSDSDDRSPGDAAFYADFLKALKGHYRVSMMHLNAVLMPAGGCEAVGDPGLRDQRYGQVAVATGGMLGSICDESWATTLSSGGSVSFHLKVQFFLAHLADPLTVRVFLDDVECLDGWKYDAPSNAILFDPDGTCVPQPDQRITVNYNELCRMT